MTGEIFKARLMMKRISVVPGISLRALDSLLDVEWIFVPVVLHSYRADTRVTMLIWVQAKFEGARQS